MSGCQAEYLAIESLDVCLGAGVSVKFLNSLWVLLVFADLVTILSVSSGFATGVGGNRGIAGSASADLGE